MGMRKAEKEMEFKTSLAAAYYEPDTVSDGAAVTRVVCASVLGSGDGEVEGE
jgi:hypothetical protein